MSTIGSKTSKIVGNFRFQDTITLVKSENGSYVDGLYVEGTEEIIELEGHHQPATDDSRSNLPEGERLREVKNVWVKSFDKDLIRPMRQGTDNSRGDVLIIDNIDYEVYFVDNYSLNGHIMAIAVRREDQSD